MVNDVRMKELRLQASVSTSPETAVSLSTAIYS
jgi:hypothetical protein